MTQITLVLPFSLPPPELATDLVRALQTPALAALVARTSKRIQVPIDDDSRTLPHEAWLAKALGISSTGRAAFAAAAMRGYGLDPADGVWFIVNPNHVEIARKHLLMSDLRQLRLSDAHARALFETARPYFKDSGKSLVYADAQTWFMRADDWSELSTASPDAATNLNLTDWMPKGPGAQEFRKLQNEVQMMWFEHPVNVERESQGLAAVNSFWPWGAAGGADVAQPASPVSTCGAPAWLNALAQQSEVPLPGLFQDWPCDGMLVYGDLSEAAIAGDWSSWLLHMQYLDETLFAPALAAIREGRLGSLQLVLSHRSAQLDLCTTKMAQYAFWRKPSLARLLP
jgi:hypothetical protein